MNTTPISYGMNGPWSAILRGAYKKEIKKKIKCKICFQSFTNEGNLENHMKYKHVRCPIVSSKKAISLPQEQVVKTEEDFFAKIF